MIHTPLPIDMPYPQGYTQTEDFERWVDSEQRNVLLDVVDTLEGVAFEIRRKLETRANEGDWT